MSLRVSFDMTAYIIEFILPVWMVAEVLIQAYRWMKDNDNWVLSSMVLTLCICFFFVITLFYSLRKYVKLKPMKNIVQSVQTASYMMILWVPIAIFIIFKIIFMKNTMDWGKTQHGNALITEKISEVENDDVTSDMSRKVN